MKTPEQIICEIVPNTYAAFRIVDALRSEGYHIVSTPLLGVEEIPDYRGFEPDTLMVNIEARIDEQLLCSKQVFPARYGYRNLARTVESVVENFIREFVLMVNGEA